MRLLRAQSVGLTSSQIRAESVGSVVRRVLAESDKMAHSASH